MAINILFVCSGNTCRSPMAEAMLKSKLPEEIKSAYLITSAGTEALEGLPATAHAAQAMHEEGIDLSAHRSRPITERLIERADLILALSRQHREFIETNFPEASGKTFLFAEYADKSAKGIGIPDPIGGPLEDYRHIRDRIKEYILRLVAKM
jgi:protein-tyrosine-phosphatase